MGVEDGNCDDKNNNCGCGWDGGDCCGINGDKFQRSYCKKCECRDPDDSSFVVKKGCKGKKQCAALDVKGDGRCDDLNNNCGCDWDNGDCCGSSGDEFQFEPCKDCKCLDPSY